MLMRHILRETYVATTNLLERLVDEGREDASLMCATLSDHTQRLNRRLLRLCRLLVIRLRCQLPHDEPRKESGSEAN